MRGDRIAAHEPQFPQESQCGPQLLVHAADQEPRAADYGPPDVRERDWDLVEQEVEDWVEVEVGIAGEELGVHVEDPAQSRALDAHGGEAALDGLDGRERGGPEIGVQTEGLVGVDVEVVLEVQDFLPETEAGVGVGEVWAAGLED